MADDPALDLLHQHYELGLEEPRLDQPLGSVEFARTLEVAARVLPPPPAAVVADIGGGPGRYALELAGRGYTVVHRDLVPLHVEQLRGSDGGGRVDSAVADARALDLPAASVDAVLLLGPLYHLPGRADRLQALAEARRVGRPGAIVVAAAISRWAPRLHGVLTQRLYLEHPQMLDLVDGLEVDGVIPPLHPGSFTGYAHRPDQLRDEVVAAGLVVIDLVGVEGLAFAIGDLADRLADPLDREVVLGTARAGQRVPELLGLSPHLLAVARVP
jgi:SAM-dependent methyltransferase